MKMLPIVALLVIVLMALSACSATSTPSSTPPPSSSSPSTTTQATTSTGGGQTYAQAAAAGQTVFSSRCAKCHGGSGQGGTGPTLIGTGSNLGKYSTSQGLLNFYKATMPFDAPGSLSSQDYTNILAFLMVQNNYLSANTAFDSNALLNVQLK